MSKLEINGWIIVICITSLLCVGCSQETPAETSPTQETPAVEWDGCRLYYGLDLEEITLDDETQNSLADLLFDYDLQKTSNTPTPPEEILLGGPYFRALFTKDGTAYQWDLGPNRITKTVSKDSSSNKTYYEPDSKLLSLLDNYRN